jgi:hypothetical protein
MCQDVENCIIRLNNNQANKQSKEGGKKGGGEEGRMKGDRKKKGE